MPESSFFSSVGQRVDDALTRYLRNTTTDQEIRDFYGEGNIVGRKGIPQGPDSRVNDAALVDRALDKQKEGDRLRPFNSSGRESFEKIQSLVDIPGTSEGPSGRSWQMNFTNLDFPTTGKLTEAAHRFLNDFRVPLGVHSDYGFEISPNVEDVKSHFINKILNDPGSYKNSSMAYRGFDESLPPSQWGPLWNPEKIDKYKNMESGIMRFSNQMATPAAWEKQGFFIPSGLKENVLSTFKDQILKSEKPFGSVSSLTPVQEDLSNVKPGGNADWRRRLYEKQGFAGPETEITIRGRGWAGDMTDNIQMFVRGNQGLLPIQPRTEFLDPTRNPLGVSSSSALGTEPAPDFTRLQKAIGTRNYLIGRNILQGRGSLGQGLSSGLRVGAADFIPTPEAIRDFYANKPVEGLQKIGENFVSGIPLAASAAGAVTLAPALAPLATGVGAGMGTVALARAADEVSRQQSGEGLLTKFRQAIGTENRTGMANPTRGSSALTPRPLGSRATLNGQPVLWAGPDYGYQSSGSYEKLKATGGLRQAPASGPQSMTDARNYTDTWTAPQIRPLTSAQRQEMTRQQNMNPRLREAQDQLRLAGARFNPSKGEFGISETVKAIGSLFGL